MDPIDPNNAPPVPPESGTWSDESALRIALTREMYNVTTDAARGLGVSRAEQQEAMRQSLESDERSRPSRSVLKIGTEISLLIATWRRDSRYLQPDGSPKTLPIYGPGTTFESLVKFCVPDVPVNDVVSILCTHSDVKRLNGEKIAILGDPVKLTERTVATSVAYLATQVRHLAETVVHNAKIPASARGKGRFERMIFGTLPEGVADQWMQQVRGPLQRTSDQVEVDLEQQPSGEESDQKICGIGIFVFREDGDIG